MAELRRAATDDETRGGGGGYAFGRWTLANKLKSDKCNLKSVLGISRGPRANHAERGACVQHEIEAPLETIGVEVAKARARTGPAEAGGASDGP
jgi:hypothetical protein